MKVEKSEATVSSQSYSVLHKTHDLPEFLKAHRLSLKRSSFHSEKNDLGQGGTFYFSMIL